MRYRTLGRTGLSVSEIAFGGGPAGLRNYLGAWDPSTDAAVDQMERAIARAVELGINVFDAAPGYGNGLAETMLGRALRPLRDRVALATKVQGSTADDVRRSLDASLERLQTDHVDLLQYHGLWLKDAEADDILKPGGVLAGMQAARAEGLTRFVGFSSEGANGPVSRLIATGEFDVLQICYNLIFQHPYDPARKAGALYEAEAQGMGILTMRGLSSGIFQRWLERIDPGIGSRVDLSRALLDFVLSNPLVDSAIVGLRTPAKVDADCAIVDEAAFRLDIAELHGKYVK